MLGQLTGHSLASSVSLSISRVYVCVCVTLTVSEICLQCFDTLGWESGSASVLWKNWAMRCWRGYLYGERCRWFAYGPADATATPSSLASLKLNWFNLPGAGLSRLSWEKRPLKGFLSVWLLLRLDCCRLFLNCTNTLFSSVVQFSTWTHQNDCSVLCRDATCVSQRTAESWQLVVLQTTVVNCYSLVLQCQLSHVDYRHCHSSDS